MSGGSSSIGVGIALLAAGGYVIVQSLGIGGRGLDLRTWIYNTAIELFAEHPLTGHGLVHLWRGLIAAQFAAAVRAAQPRP